MSRARRSLPMPSGCGCVGRLGIRRVLVGGSVPSRRDGDIWEKLHSGDVIDLDAHGGQEFVERALAAGVVFAKRKDDRP